ncbi:Uncharacterised protein [Bordetella pertussis]|nr:Uncharacterised protein [Bordetella pertussis]
MGGISGETRTTWNMAGWARGRRVHDGKTAILPALAWADFSHGWPACAPRPAR